MRISHLAAVTTGENDFRNSKTPTLPVFESFYKKLKDNEQTKVFPYLNGMIHEIDKQSKRLAQTLNINELRYYKKMVCDFLQQALCIASVLEKETMTDRKGRKHIYVMVKKVNQKIDDLVSEFMKEEKSNIEIIKMIDDIRGMLIDLLM